MHDLLLLVDVVAISATAASVDVVAAVAAIGGLRSVNDATPIVCY